MKFLRKLLWPFVGLVVLGFGCVGYAYFIEPFRLVVNAQNVPTVNADESIEGLRIVAISDIHGGSQGVDAEKIRRVVETANAQDADLIVLLGDFVSESAFDRRKLRMPVAEIGKNLAGLKAKLGVFAVLGNHDGWYGDAEIRAALVGAGITVLENEVRVIDRGDGRRFRLLGLKDHLKLDSWGRFDTDVKAAVAKQESVGKVIVLEHSPDILEILNELKTLDGQFGLMLAGHTHGGQVWFPIIGTPIVPSSYGQKYSYGHVRDREKDIFVTSGVGESILPLRFMMPPEVAVVTITRQ